MNNLCNVCHTGVPSWAWQPFGPGKTPDTFTLLGSHYRGFTVVAVCDDCKNAYQRGEPLLIVAKRKRYLVTGAEVLGVSTFSDGIHVASLLARQVRDRWQTYDHPDWHGGVRAGNCKERTPTCAVGAINDRR
jgi:hypothetical protein